MSFRYVVTPGSGIAGLEKQNCDAARPGPGEILVRMRAASLNFRDLLIANGVYPGGSPGPVVPLSDGAGEIVEVGPGCTRFKAGDRVAGIFMQSWLAGEMTDADGASALGGAVDGVLSAYRVFREDGLVRIPDSLSYEEASTLPCAGLTAWNALYEHVPLKAGQTVLILGTGGVSIFALQMAAAAGARPIITSSSDAKLERCRAMGAWQTINYTREADWAAVARDLTGGIGVDMVIETGGPGTLPMSVASTRRGGSIEMIGVLTQGTMDPLQILTSGVIVRGIMVGSRAMFEAMNKGIEATGLKPMIDHVFPAADAGAAYAYLAAAGHMGKVVIRFDD